MLSLSEFIVFEKKSKKTTLLYVSIHTTLWPTFGSTVPVTRWISGSSSVWAGRGGCSFAAGDLWGMLSWVVLSVLHGPKMKCSQYVMYAIFFGCLSSNSFAKFHWICCQIREMIKYRLTNLCYGHVQLIFAPMGWSDRVRVVVLSCRWLWGTHHMPKVEICDAERFIVLGVWCSWPSFDNFKQYAWADSSQHVVGWALNWASPCQKVSMVQSCRLDDCLKKARTNKFFHQFRTDFDRPCASGQGLSVSNN